MIYKVVTNNGDDPRDIVPHAVVIGTWNTAYIIKNITEEEYNLILMTLDIRSTRDNLTERMRYVRTEDHLYKILLYYDADKRVVAKTRFRMV